jgi:hypothetical protein
MKNASPILRRMPDVTKIILSAGFWLTIALFVALGYALGDECPGSLNCADGHSAIATSILQDEHRDFANDARVSDAIIRSRCAPRATLRGTAPGFPQVANWQRGGSMYAPGLSLTMTRRPGHVTLCPGPVEIPNSLNQ